MSDIAIKVEGLSKRYLVGHQVEKQKYVALRDVIARNAASFARKTVDMFKGRPIVQGDEVEEFWALKDINLEIKQGDRIGIIGRNGAGKSTLLKILSRITEPTTGRVQISGRVASLLEVGTGFHPELTGRENIFLNGAILGMSRAEIQKKFDEIIAFAEVEKFLDIPVKRYSSGMYVRLAFSVAAHIQPEILIVDEVLSVGDINFQSKCLKKIKSLGDGGTTVLFVSHHIPTVLQLASSGIALGNGKIFSHGAIADVVDEYIRRSTPSEISSSWKGEEGNDLIVLTSLEIHPQKSKEHYSTSDELEVILDLEVFQPVVDLVVGCDLINAEGANLAYSAQHDVPNSSNPTEVLPGKYQFSMRIPEHTLAEGSYQISADVGLHNRIRIVKHACVKFEVVNDNGIGRRFRAEGKRFTSLFRPAWQWKTSKTI